MFDQLKKYFYLYRKDIFYNIVFLVLFILFLSLFVKICLIDTGIINIIDSTKINIPLDSDLNNSKKVIAAEEQKKIINNNDVPFYKTMMGFTGLVLATGTILYVVGTVVIEFISKTLE